MKERKEKVLKETVKHYIKTGEPVSSKMVLASLSLKIGASTVRNELNQLEKDGYLTHVHTSSGRIPTDLGYRKYVNEINVKQQNAAIDTVALKEIINPFENNVEAILTQVSQVMGNLLDYSLVVLTPDAYKEVLKKVL